MRTTMNFPSLKMLGTALLSLLFISACQQEMDPVSKQMDSDNILANAGKIHNDMISYYYANRSTENAPSELMLSELFDLSWEYLEKNGYDAKEIQETKLLMGEKLNTSYLKSMTVDGYSIDTARFISQLEATSMYSQEFITEINKVLVLANMDDDRQKIKDYVNAAFMNIEFDDDQDRAAQSLFANVFNGSFDFWEMKDETSLKSTHLKRSSFVIINDGIGAVLGSIFGPIGSIVVGTAFSVATNEEIKD